MSIRVEHQRKRTQGMTMMKQVFSRSSMRRREHSELARRLLPGQFISEDFPVFSSGPASHHTETPWDFAVVGAVEKPQRWNWAAFHALPHESITVDIHFGTKWSKLDTMWEGVALDTLLGAVKPQGKYLLAFSDGGETINLPIADVLNHRAWIVDTYAGAPLPAAHGGPARLLIPHLYFWQSAKWVRGLRVLMNDQPAFWASYSCHTYRDPWQDQHY